MAKARSHQSGRAGRWAALAAGLACAGCASFPGAGNRAVSPRTLAKLEAGSVRPEEIGLRRTGSGFVMKGTWGAPRMVQTALEWDHHLPHLHARVNGRTAKFILDTGSQVSVLEADTAVHCAVRTLKRSDGNFTLSGITGEESALMGVPDRVEIGAWHWSRMPLMVRTRRSDPRGSWLLDPARLAVNIIGLDALRRMCAYVTLDYPRSRITFGFHDRFQPDPDRKSWHVPMEFRDHLPQVRVGDGRHSWQAIVDTGCASAVEIDLDTAERAGLRHTAVPSSVMRVGVGASDHGGSRPAGEVRLGSLERLGPKLLRVPALIVPDRSKIGSGLFSPFRVTLDFRRSWLWLESAR